MKLVRFLLTLLALAQVCRADSTTVATAANTLITTASAQTSPNALASGYNPSQSLTLSNAEKWTNLPGTPPNDSARVGPVMGGGPSSFTVYELSGTVSSGETVSPRTAALNTAAAALSTAGYTEMYEIRNADDLLLSSGNNGYSYGDYRVDVLTSGTPSSTSDFIIKYAGHHLAYNITYNFPSFNNGKAYISASPMFLGLEPPDYHSTGTDLTNSSSSSAENAFIVGTSGGTANTIIASYPYNSASSQTTVTAANAASTLPSRVNVTASAISGATAATYTISSVANSDNGFYFCKVANASGTTNSITVALTVALDGNANLYNASSSTGASPAPIISTQPQSQTVATGSSATFSVVASNATSYQWYKIATTHRAAVERQRSAASELAAALQADSALASSAKLAATFSDVALAPTGSGDTNFPPSYPTGTTGRGVLFGSMTTAEQATIKPLVKQLIEAYVNNVSTDAASVLLADYESDLAISNTYIGYQVGAGSADSTGVTRCNFDSTVNQEATPTNSQHSYIRIDGPRCWIEIVVQNAIIYQSNGFVHYHSLYRDRLSDYGNEFGGYLDTTNTSTTYTRPAISTQPASQTVNSGSSVTLTVAAAGTIPIYYQWYENGAAISSATNASYTITSATPSNAGAYFATVTNVYGAVISSTASLTVNSAPAISSQPLPESIVTGSTASFSVTASGSGTLTYQWYFNTTAIAGATSSTLTFATTATNAGNYYVVVSNTFGSTQSNTVTLSLTEPWDVFLSSYGLSGVSASADSDNDGVPNLLEFVLGGNPTASDSSILPVASSASTGGTNYLVLKFYSLLNLGSVTWRVEASPNLSAWTAVSSGSSGVVITSSTYNSSFYSNAVAVPMSPPFTSGSSMFLRLKATLPAGIQ